jgi:cell cycle arrest protein BUB3
MDGITDLCYIPCSSTTSAKDVNANSNDRILLASSSWDGCIRIHDTTEIDKGAKLLTLQNMESGPILSMDAYTLPCHTTRDDDDDIDDKNDNNNSSSGSDDLTDSFVVTAGLDGSIHKFKISTSEIQNVGSHYLPDKITNANTNADDCACSCIKALSNHYVASAGWDSMFYIWDTKTLNNAPVAKIQLPDKAFSMDAIPLRDSNKHQQEQQKEHHQHSIHNNTESYRIAISTAGKRLIIIDVHQLNTPTPTATITLNRESSLKYQSRICKFFPDGIGLAIGSIEGRVAIEFLQELDVSPPSNMKKYAFKCHRSNDIVYPVNALAFHPTLGTFASGGCDGTVVTWDGLHKKKLTVLPLFETSIAALAFNHDGTQLAIASSYTFEEGDKYGIDIDGNNNENGKKVKDEIYIKLIADKDVTPKSAK